jgi:8-oxo-dGTP diphosphatase
MSQDDGRWAAAFPALFAKSYVDYADCQLGFTTHHVPDELVARLHLVAMTPQRHVIVCRSIQGWRFLPGGTREEGESLVELARRELLEEAGARMTGSVEIFASHVADSLRDGPYRPHLPFTDRFERQVDPDGVLEPTERARRAQSARKAFFMRLALKSAQARRARRSPSV